MRKVIYVFACISFLNYSCTENNRNEVDNGRVSESLRRSLGYDDLTLSSLPADTNAIFVEKYSLSGGYLKFLFKKLPESISQPGGAIRGLYIELRQDENRNTPQVYFDSLNVVNYRSFAFKIPGADWDTIRRRAEQIEEVVDTTYKDYFCEFCPSYVLIYNNKIIESKFIRDSLIEKLVDFLVVKYQGRLYDSRK